MTVGQLSDGRGMTAEVADGCLLHSLTVTLRLGESRDVVLGLKDKTKYVRRRDGEFAPPKNVCPSFFVRDGALIVDYPAGEEPETGILFNLKGHGVGNIEDHNLTVFADCFLDNGKPCDVSDTPLDFREETPIGERIRVGYAPLVEKKGYDHIFILRPQASPVHAATLMDRMRTLQMDVYTSFPALRLYTGNRMSGKDIGKGGCIYPKRGGVALMPCRLHKEPSDEDGQAKKCGRVEYRFKSLL